MTDFFNAYWNLLEQGAQQDLAQWVRHGEVTLHLGHQAWFRFKDIFQEHYRQTQGQMLHADHPLDRHKVAAIGIISGIETGFLDTGKLAENLMLEQVAIRAGLSSMCLQLNDKLRALQLPEAAGYLLPLPFNCRTTYLYHLARRLHNTRADGQPLNVFELADRLFLLEYITLQKLGIDPEHYAAQL